MKLLLVRELESKDSTLIMNRYKDLGINALTFHQNRTHIGTSPAAIITTGVGQFGSSDPAAKMGST